MDAREQALNLFDGQFSVEYRPHLSLLYANLDEETARSLLQHLPSSPLRSFEVKTLQLVSTEGPVDNWYQVREFTLGVS